MSKDTEKILLYTVLAIGGYMLLKGELGNLFGQKPLTSQQTGQMLKSAGLEVTNTQSGTFAKVDGGVVKIDNTWTPNLAQKILVGLDAFIPGTWLTKKVYGL